MLKLVVDYPNRDDELNILNANANVSVSHEVNPVVDAETIFKSRELVDGIYLDDKLKGYLVDVVLATRNPDAYGASELGAFIRFGASPRATITLLPGSCIHERKKFCHPKILKTLALMYFVIG